MQNPQAHTVLFFTILLLGSACSLVTGSGDLVFERESAGGDGDETGGSTGDGDEAGGSTGNGDGDETGGSTGDGDGAGGAGSGGTASGGNGSGVGGSVMSDFTGISYQFENDLEGWSLLSGNGWGTSADPGVLGEMMHAELYCDLPPCEAVYFVNLDPVAPAESLQLFLTFSFTYMGAAAFSCQFGFTCGAVDEWLWSSAFGCDYEAGLISWNEHRDANSECSISRFGLRVSTSDQESAEMSLDYLSLLPPD